MPQVRSGDGTIPINEPVGSKRSLQVNVCSLLSDPTGDIGPGQNRLDATDASPGSTDPLNVQGKHI